MPGFRYMVVGTIDDPKIHSQTVIYLTPIGVGCGLQIIRYIHDFKTTQIKISAFW